VKKFLTISALVLAAIAAKAQDEEAAIREGNKQYKQGAYDKALPEYQKAIQKNPKNVTAQYNAANARFRSNKFDDAQKSYDDAIAATTDTKFKEKSYYNKGVSYSKEKKLQESINAWKNALKLDPNDEDARFNLQKALNEQKKNNESKQQKQQQQQQQKQQQQKQQQQKQQNKLDKRKIEQYLKSLQQKEQEVQRKIQQNRSRSVSQPEKDW
jgi:tetratricopeptide (TPR) repeat protein